MMTSVKGKLHLIYDEGNKTKAYKDSVGIWTIGVGYTRIEGRPVKEGDVLTLEQITAMLPEVLKEYEDAVNQSVTVPLHQHEFDACVCLAYNIGAGGFKGSTVVKLINAGQKRSAEFALAWFMWHKPFEIVKRRWNDANLFIKGVYLG